MSHESNLLQILKNLSADKRLAADWPLFRHKLGSNAESGVFRCGGTPVIARRIPVVDRKMVQRRLFFVNSR